MYLMTKRKPITAVKKLKKEEKDEPPRECVTPFLKELLDGKPNEVKARWLETEGRYTGAMEVALALYEKMFQGDLPSIKEVLDRVEGKSMPPAGSAGANKIEVEFINDDRKAEDST